MNALLFLIDDNSSGFWEREQKATWSFHLDNCGMMVDKIPDAPRFVEERLRKARENTPELDALLITDQKLFGGEFDGADLAAQLIKDKIVKRAVVFSIIARLRPEQQKLPFLIAEPRIDNPKAIAGIFRFLETGRRPRTDELFEYGERIRHVLTFFAENVKNCSLEMLKLEGDPQDRNFLFDPWLLGLGADVPELFSQDSLGLLDEHVKTDVLQYLGPENDEMATAKWTRVYSALHPWKSLELAGQPASHWSYTRGGAFRLLIEFGRCGGRAELVSGLLSEERNFSPRNRAWIIERRKNLKTRIEMMLNSSSSLSYCVQQCISELSEVCHILKTAAEIRDQK